MRQYAGFQVLQRVPEYRIELERDLAIVVYQCSPAKAAVQWLVGANAHKLVERVVDVDPASTSWSPIRARLARCISHTIIPSPTAASVVAD